MQLASEVDKGPSLTEIGYNTFFLNVFIEQFNFEMSTKKQTFSPKNIMFLDFDSETRRNNKLEQTREKYKHKNFWLSQEDYDFYDDLDYELIGDEYPEED